MEKSTRFFSKKQEQQIAKALKGKVQSNSGAADFTAGDVKTEHCLIDAKTVMTSKKSVSIHKDWLLKIKDEAFAMNKDFGVVAINFGPNQPNYYVLEEKQFKDYLRLYEKECNFESC